MMKMLLFPVRLFKSIIAKSLFIVLFFLAVSFPVRGEAKPSSEQDEIILLNDSASALEDSDQALAKRLTQLADEREKVWELDNANKDPLPIPITDKYIHSLKDQVKLLDAAQLEIKPTYPAIALGLRKMIKELNRVIENHDQI